MRLYLDDNCNDPVLTAELRKAGHDVRLPSERGAAGRNDQVHHRHAISEDRVVLTKDHDDFEELHDLVREARGHHPGILAIRADNRRKHDMDIADIKRALRKLEAAGFDMHDQFQVLNHWQ